MVDKATLTRQLNIVIALSRWDTFPQGSDEWKANRINSIGCSEHYKATNTAASRKQVLTNKITEMSIDGVAAIKFGNAFESSCSSISEIYFDCDILDAPGSIKADYGSVTCSPDGLGVVELSKVFHDLIMRQYFEKKPYTEEGKKPRFRGHIPMDVNNMHSEGKRYAHIILFEFKSPYSRVIKEGMPSEEYSRQVLMGLSVLDYPSAGIFIEMDFEVTLDELWFDYSYYEKGVKTDKPKKDYGVVEYIGYKYFLGDRSHVGTILKEDIPYGRHTDYSNLDGDNSFTKFHMIDSPIIHVSGRKYHNHFFENLRAIGLDPSELENSFDALGATNRYDTAAFFREMSEFMFANRTFAELRWKMLKSNVQLFLKYENLIDRWADQCDDLICKIREVSALPVYQRQDAIFAMNF
jgi:hypothetical protein